MAVVGRLTVKTERTWLALAVAAVIVILLVGLAGAVIVNNQMTLLERAVQTDSAWVQRVNGLYRPLLIGLGISLFGGVCVLCGVMIGLRRVDLKEEETLSRLRRANTDLEVKLTQRSTELADERTHSTTILQNLTEAVLVLDQGRIRYSNRAFANLTGFTPEELNGQLTSDKSLALINKVRDLFQVVSRNGNAAWRGEIQLPTQDGRHIELQASAARLANGASPRWIIAMRDLSLEQKFREHRSNLAHEMRTPLSTLRYRLHLVRKNPGKLDEHLVVMEEMADLLAQLLKDLIDIGRIKEGDLKLDLQKLDLGDVLEDTVSTFRPRANKRAIGLLTDYTGTTVMVKADQERLTQAITNVITKAANQTPQNGRVAVKLELVKPTSGEPRAYIEVCDSGPGLSQKAIEYLFKPLDHASTGLVTDTVLGLSLAKQILQLHGGDLEVESQEGQGTTFRMWLPAAS